VSKKNWTFFIWT